MLRECKLQMTRSRGNNSYALTFCYAFFIHSCLFTPKCPRNHVVACMRGENNEKKMFDCELRDSVVSNLSFYWL